MIPTQEQIKEFWEKCGFRYENIAEPYYHIWFTLVYPNGVKKTIWRMLPSIDPTNLFEYAVPELVKGIGLIDTRKLMVEWARRLTGDYKKDALALFWAIWEVIHDTDK